LLPHPALEFTPGEAVNGSMALHAQRHGPVVVRPECHAHAVAWVVGWTAHVAAARRAALPLAKPSNVLGRLARHYVPPSLVYWASATLPAKSITVSSLY
jgi:hypothetical protein